MNHAARRDRITAALREPGLDALLINSEGNVRYLTGFTGGSSLLIVTLDRCLLVSDGRFTEQIAEESPDVAEHIRPLGETTLDAAAKLIEKMGVRQVGVEGNHLSVVDFLHLQDKVKTATWKPTKKLVENLRIIKDDDEVTIIRRAVQVAERVYSEFRSALRPNDSEFDLTDRVESLIRKHGGRASSFEPITAVGDRSALAHAPATDRLMKTGAWLLLDWGCIVDGYVSDLTRVLIPDTPLVRSPMAPPVDRTTLEPVWRAVLAARDAALAVCRPGTATKDVDAAARAAIEAAGYGDKFTHSLGHGIGLAVHEGPGLRADSDEKLAAGMVVTIEPGIYIAGWGGVRIEDDVLVTPDGPELLSTLPLDLEAALV